ncbi:MAG: hypothetical protein AB7Y46_14500 [Armatimonadota bacterium]
MPVPTGVGPDGRRMLCALVVIPMISLLPTDLARTLTHQIPWLDLNQPPAINAEPDDRFGCEDNPTGDPIGGGPGYRDIHRTGDFVVTSADELVEALAVAQAGQVVFVPGGLELDLTDLGTLEIPGGVTLAGDRGADGSEGALLIARGQRQTLLSTAGEDVRVTGLRFEGAYGGAERVATQSRFMSIGHTGGRVDNCEIYNFNLSGIGVAGTALRVVIDHNYLHHIQLGGLGYPISTSSSDLRVIANRFDYGRHHIASSGAPGSGYEAAWNHIGPNATSHHFDMHGGRDRGDNTTIAGDWMHVHHNTFEGSRPHVVIRGVPSQGAWIHNNWFSGPAAEKVRSDGNTWVYQNVYGPDRVLEEGER